jgi:hypothetical protein
MDLFKDAFTSLQSEMDNKYKELYNTLINNICIDICKDEFTPNYGSISNEIWYQPKDSKGYDGKKEVFDELPKGKWYIHYLYYVKGELRSTVCHNLIAIDNYGNTYNKGWSNYNTGWGDNPLQYPIQIINNNKYPLPNKIIDYIKTIKNGHGFIDSTAFNIIGEFFHNKFIQYKDLYISGKLKDYEEIYNKNISMSKKIIDQENEIINKNKIISIIQKELDETIINNQTNIINITNEIVNKNKIIEDKINELNEQNKDIETHKEYINSQADEIEENKNTLIVLKNKYNNKKDTYLKIIEKLTKENRSLRKQIAFMALSESDNSDDEDYNADYDNEDSSLNHNEFQSIISN